jgi:DNA mismatch repair protein MutS
MDKFTMRNLELFYSPHFGAKTFFDIINQTQSPMGARLLNRWLSLPLKNLDEIQKRLDIVGVIKDNHSVEQVLLENINKIGDLERLIAKVSTLRINPKEIEKLKDALFSVDPIKSKCNETFNKPLDNLIVNLNPCVKIRDKIKNQLHPNPPLMLSKGNVINVGVDKQLDELRDIKKSVNNFLDKMLEREIEKTSISSLKISYNNVFGYYLEVRNSHKEKVPDQWIRKQTLVNAERYITEELKEYEVKILSADEKISLLEQKLYSQLVLDISKELVVLKKNYQIIKYLD